MVGSAFEIRNDSDYEDMFIASKAETEEQIRNAEDVLQKIGEYLKSENVLPLSWEVRFFTFSK